MTMNVKSTRDLLVEKLAVDETTAEKLAYQIEDKVNAEDITNRLIAAAPLTKELEKLGMESDLAEKIFLKLATAIADETLVSVNEIVESILDAAGRVKSYTLAIQSDEEVLELSHALNSGRYKPEKTEEALKHIGMDYVPVFLISIGGYLNVFCRKLRNVEIPVKKEETTPAPAKSTEVITKKNSKETSKSTTTVEKQPSAEPKPAKKEVESETPTTAVATITPSFLFEGFLKLTREEQKKFLAAATATYDLNS